MPPESLDTENLIKQIQSGKADCPLSSLFLQLGKHGKHDFADLLHALRTHLIQRIRRRMVEGIIGSVIEVDNIHARDSGIQKWEMIIADRGFDLGKD